MEMSIIQKLDSLKVTSISFIVAELDSPSVVTIYDDNNIIHAYPDVALKTIEQMEKDISYFDFWEKLYSIHIDLENGYC